MNREIAKSLLDKELAGARNTGYRTLMNYAGGNPLIREVVGRDGEHYQLEANVLWDGKKNGAIRVIVSVDDGGWRAFAQLSVSDIIYPD